MSIHDTKPMNGADFIIIIACGCCLCVPVHLYLEVGGAHAHAGKGKLEAGCGYLSLHTVYESRASH